MVTLGLTGGVGTGKSAVAALLSPRGVRFIDTDELARALTQPGQPVLARISAEFGGGVLNERGELDRRQLADRVFADPVARVRLEAILHPPIRAAWQRQLADWTAAGEQIGVVVIPLLFETGCEAAFDHILCTGCGSASQRERLRARGWSEAQIEGRLAAQWPLKRKLERADFVLWTEGAMTTTAAQLELILDRVRPSAG